MASLALCPRIEKVAGKLKVSTPWTVLILSLGTLYKRVFLDPNAKTIVITARYAWFIQRRQVVTFEEVAAVTFGYKNMSPDSVLSFAHDAVDSFSVGLRLKGRRELHLFSFVGEGAFENTGPFPDWFYWPEQAFDFEGNQQQVSRVFVDLISRMIDVKVVPPAAY